MPDYKVTYLFKQFDCGWSETWYLNRSTIELARGFAIEIAPFRMIMQGRNVIMEAVRISDVTIKGDSLFYVFPALQPTQAFPQDTPWNSWLVRANATPLYRRSIFLRGVPDIWIAQDDQGVYPIPGDLQNSVDAWQDRMFGNFAIQVATKVPDINYIRIDALLESTDGYVRIAANIPGPPAIGSSIKMKFWQGPDKALLNGTHVVRFSEPGFTVINTQYAALTNPAANFGGKVIAVVFLYPTITSLQILRVVRKATGRSFFQCRGRRAKRR